MEAEANRTPVSIEANGTAGTVPFSVGDYLTMNQIVALTQQGVASHYVYGLTASDLSWLRQHGVAEEVIQAMKATNTTSPTNNNPSAQIQSQVINKVWGWVQNKINGL